MVILEFTDRNLVVNIEEFKIVNSNPFDGTNYYSYEPSKIYGRFTVDTLSNKIKDVHNCLGNPFDKRPKINLFDNRYELIITSVNIDFVENYGSNYYAIYCCDFMAVPLHTNVPKPAEPNSIWDAGGGGFNINDLNEIIGEDPYVVEKKVIEMIENYSRFVPSAECPTPSNVENATKADDLAAVLAGTKPAVVIDELHLSNPLVTMMCLEANARGLAIDTVVNFSKTRSLVIGEKYNVKQIVEIMSTAVSTGNINDFFYYQLARLTGFPDEALEGFVDSIKDFGFNRV